MVVAVLFKAGNQVPVTGIVLVDDNGNGCSVAPEHIGPTAGNVGVVFGFTVTVNVVPATHPAEVGVNSYEPDRVLSTLSGVQNPVMPLVEVSGNVGTLPLWQIVSDVPNGKVAVSFGITTVVSVVGIPQVPAAGVKV